MPIIRRAILIGLLATAASCGEPSTRGGLASPVPAARIHAMTSAPEASSPAELKALVEQLDSDDAAVRMTAITALRRATGETHGYRFEDDAPARDAAVERWVNYLRDRADDGNATLARGSAHE